MSLWAIGDVHGQRNALEALMRAIKPKMSDRIVFLGDYVDRGPDSCGVIEFLMRLSAQMDRVVFLRGNHEHMMSAARQDPKVREYWLSQFEGNATLGSYGGALEDVPDLHWRFIENLCVNWYISHDHLFVHGGVRSELPIEDQLERDLHWRRVSDAALHCSGMRVVCGHTKQKSGKPLNLGHTACIDTLGWLTAYEVLSHRVVQVSITDGEVRSYSMPSPG